MMGKRSRIALRLTIWRLLPPAMKINAKIEPAVRM
jgi:hypothetical protein